MPRFVQDMPPPNGYPPITYEQIPLKKGYLNAKFRMAAALLVTGLGWVNLNRIKEQLTLERIEMRCAKLALIPMIHAETDRMLLKQLRKNREWEEKLMKHVKGWQVGKWKSSPVYLTLGPDDYFMPSAEEYYAHSHPAAISHLVYLTERN